MPKMIDPKAKERCVQQVLEHLPKYPSLTAAAKAFAPRGPGQGDGAPLVRLGPGRRWTAPGRDQ